jgi:hypothetical protein
MPTFNKLRLPGYNISAKLINGNDERSTRHSLFYLTGTDLDLFIKAIPNSEGELVWLKYEWRLLRFNGSDYVKTEKEDLDYLRGYPLSDKPMLFGKLNIPFVIPAGTYKLQLKVFRNDEVITYPEWVDLFGITLWDKDNAKHNLVFLVAGTILGAIVTAIITWVLKG